MRIEIKVEYLGGGRIRKARSMACKVLQPITNLLLQQRVQASQQAMFDGGENGG